MPIPRFKLANLRRLIFIADNLKKAGWSWGFVAATDSNERTIWIVDAHRDNGQRFIVQADEKLTAFVELELVIRTFKRTYAKV
jgi:predicted ATPase